MMKSIHYFLVSKTPQGHTQVHSRTFLNTEESEQKKLESYDSIFALEHFPKHLDESLKNLGCDGLAILLEDQAIQSEFAGIFQEGHWSAAELKAWPTQVPLFLASQLGMDAAKFSALSGQEAGKLFEKAQRQWITAQNLRSIRELAHNSDALKELLQTDRLAFFEELWNLMKMNLGARDLRFYFHDLVGQDPALAKGLKAIKMSGHLLPQTQDAMAGEEKLLEHYQEDFAAPYVVKSFDAEKGELVLCCKINHSPLLILAKGLSFQALQDAWLAALLELLQTREVAHAKTIIKGRNHAPGQQKTGAQSQPQAQTVMN